MESESVREQALAWWNSIKNHQEKQSLSDDYTKTSGIRAYQSLTGREIEEIFLKETSHIDPTDIQSAYMMQVKSKNVFSKPNQKQFKQFDESLHKAYLNKFSDEDKFKAFVSNLNELSEEAQFNAFIAILRKMKLDSQTESNIMTLVALKDI